MSRRWWLSVLGACMLVALALAPAHSAPVPVYTYVTSWGSAGSGNGQFNSPMGVAVDASGSVLVADTGNNRLQRFTSLDASPSRSFVVSVAVVSGASPTTMIGPRGISVDASANVWVSDAGNDRLIKLNPSLAYLLQVKPGTGKQNGRVNAPNQITVANGYVWETDPAYDRVQMFSLAGAFSRATSSNSLHAPFAAAFDTTGTYCYVTSGATTNNVVRFKYTNGRLGTGAVFAGRNATGTASGQFDGARGVAVYNGYLFVADAGNNRIQVFNASNGAYVTKFGDSGPAILRNPTGLAVDRFGRIYVADTGNNRICVFYADQVAPTTTYGGPAGWSTTSPVSASLTATDGIGSGVASTFYRVNGAAVPATYAGPLSFSAEGTTTLTYWSVDGVGNTEVAKTSSVRIDTGKPLTTDDAPAGWRTSAVTVSLVASDAVSGVRATYYRLNGSATATWTGPLAISAEGTNTLQYWSVDVAGNVETTRSATVRVDISTPVTTDNAPASWLPSASVSVNLAASDAVSGVRATYYQAGASAATTYSTPIVVSAEGTTAIAYRSVDIAGNGETTHTAYVRLDRTPPVATMALDWGDDFTATTTVSVCSSATDISPMQMRVDAGSGYGGWAAYAPVVTAVVPSGDGTKTVTVQYRDSAGNTTTVSDAIRLDATAPVGTMAVNGGSDYTTSTAITVDSSFVRAVTMRVDPGTGTFGPWVTYAATVATSMPSADGVKTIRAQYRNGTGMTVTIVDTIVLDTAAPTGTMSISGGASATGTRAVTVDSAVGDLTPMQMRIDAGSGFGGWVAYTSPAAATLPAGDGTKTVTVEYRDSVGLVLTRSDTILLDTLAPATTNNAPAGWSRTPVSVTLSRVDAGSGVAQTYYRLGAGAVTTYTVPVLVAAEGVTTLQYWSVDNAGNVESAKTATVSLDTAAPVTTSDAPVDWQPFGPVTVTLNAADTGSGMLATYYRVNGGSVITYAGPFDVTAEGANTIEFWSKDVAGNVEATHSAFVGIDTVAPITTDDAPTGWSNTPVDVGLYRTDGLGSGIDSTDYVLDGDAVAVYDSPIHIASEGTHTVQYWSSDLVGNVEDSKIATVQIDLSAPMTTDNAPAGWSSVPVTVTLTALDSTSGVAATRYTINGGPVTTYSAGIGFSAEGTNTLQYWSVDNAGNAETTRTATVLVDRTAPAGTMSVNGGDTYTATVTVGVDSAVGDMTAMTMRVDGGGGYGGWMPYAASVSATVPAGNGVKTVTVQYRDAAGNVRTLSDTITLDTTAPDGTMAVSGGATYTATRTVTVDSAVVRAVDMSVDAGSGFGAWVPYASAVTTVLPAGDGVKTVRVQYRSGTGRIVTLDDDIVLDTTAPTGSMQLAGGAAYASTRTVSIDSAVVDLTPLQMRVDTGSGWSVWMPYASAVTTTLPAGDGAKSVSVQYRDAVGLVLTTSDGIVLDTQAPATSDDAPAGWQDAGVSVALTSADGGTGVKATYYLLDGGAVTTYTTPVAISAEGTHTLQYWSVDNAGNAEAAKSATVRIDLTKPVTTDNAPAGWRSASTTVALAGSDGLSGVATTYYRLNGGAVTTYTVAVAVSAEGTNSLQYWSVDNAGNAEVAKSATVRIDVTKPVTTDNAPAAWQNATTSVTLAAADSTSGIKTTYSRLNGGAVTTYTAPVVVSAEGTNTLQYWSVDNAGNTETAKSATVRIDLTKPVTTDNAPAGWQNATTSVTLAGADCTSGIKTTYYRLNGGAVTTYTTAVQVSTEGTNSLQYWSVDNAGNTETAKAATVRVDLTKPVTTDNAPAGWRNAAASVTLVASDAPSGVKATYFRLNGGAVTTYTVPVAVSAEGTNTLQYWSVDNAGNTETAKAATVRIDLTKPVTTDNSPAGWQTVNPVAVNLAATDATSGVASTYFRLNGGAITTYTVPVQVTTEGTNTVQYWSVDNAGNTETAKTATVRIDSHAPAGTMAVSSGAAYTATRTISVDSSVTGVAPVEMRIETGAGYGGWQPYASAVTTVLPAGDGAKTVTVQYRSVGGNVLTLSDTILLDTTAPSTTDDAPAGWRDSLVTVTLGASDSGVGLGWTLYRVNGGAVTTYTVPLAISAEGTTAVTYWSVDVLGNAEIPHSATVRLDLSAPVTTATYLSGWRSVAALVVTLTAGDATSGVAATYADAGSGTATYTAPLSISAEGTTTVRYWSVDNAGNAEAGKTATLRIDRTPPAGAMTLNGGDDFTGTTTVNVDSAIGDMTSMTMRVDTGSGYGGWVAYASRLATSVPSADGTKTVTVQYRDAAGNVMTRSDTIYLDGTAPEGTFVLDGGASYTGTTSVQFEPSVTRAADMRFDAGGGYGEWLAYASAVATDLPEGDGVKTVHAQFRSSTGRVVHLADDIVLDTTAPTGTVVIAGTGQYVTSRTIVVTSAVSDLTPMRMRVDGGAGWSSSLPYASVLTTQLPAGDGQRTVRVEYADALGHTTVFTRSFYLDTVTPVSAAAVTTSTTSATIRLTVTESGSGTAWTRYRLDGGAETAGTAITVNAPGAHTLTFRSADMAGNTETTRTANFIVRGALTTSEIAGPNRYETAVAISKKAFPAGASTVVLATGVNYPDALGGGALAGAYDCPILLVIGTAKTMPATVTAEVARLHASRIVILGSNTAVTDEIEAQAKKLPGVTTVQRFGGLNRYETANLVARETRAVMASRGKTFDGKAFVATGVNFPDALVASPIAYRLGRPLLLVPKTGMLPSTRSTLESIGVNAVTIVDCAAYVPSSVDATIAAHVGPVTRLNAGGSSAISCVVGAYAEGLGMRFQDVAIATSLKFPDALAAGPMQGRDGSVILLTPTTSLDINVSNALKARKGQISRVRYLGTTAAVSASVRGSVQNLLK